MIGISKFRRPLYENIEARLMPLIPFPRMITATDYPSKHRHNLASIAFRPGIFTNPGTLWYLSKYEDNKPIWEPIHIVRFSGSDVWLSGRIHGESLKGDSNRHILFSGNNAIISGTDNKPITFNLKDWYIVSDGTNTTPAMNNILTLATMGINVEVDQNTVTLHQSAIAYIDFTGDVGKAEFEQGIIRIVGSNSIHTIADNQTITINITPAVLTMIQIDGNKGSATAVNGIIKIQGMRSYRTVATGKEMTISPRGNVLRTINGIGTTDGTIRFTSAGQISINHTEHAITFSGDVTSFRKFITESGDVVPRNKSVTMAGIDFTTSGVEYFGSIAVNDNLLKGIKSGGQEARCCVTLDIKGGGAVKTTGNANNLVINAISSGPRNVAFSANYTKRFSVSRADMVWAAGSPGIRGTPSLSLTNVRDLSSTDFPDFTDDDVDVYIDTHNILSADKKMLTVLLNRTVIYYYQARANLLIDCNFTSRFFQLTQGLQFFFYLFTNAGAFEHVFTIPSSTTNIPIKFHACGRVPYIAKSLFLSPILRCYGVTISFPPLPSISEARSKAIANTLIGRRATITWLPNYQCSFIIR